MADIELEGLEQLIASLDLTSRSVQQKAWAHIQKTAKDLQSEAKSRAPVETGKLQKSIKVQYDEDALEADVGPSAFYAHYPEFGTVSMPAEPYMTPAVEKERGPFLSGLKDLFD